MRAISFVLFLSFLAGRAQAGEGDPRWYVVPNFSFDTDDGAGFGVRGELALDEPGHDPYKTAYVVHFFASTRGYHHHRFRFDRTGLFGGRFRLTGHVAYRQWLNDGYWGIGNDTVRDRVYARVFDSEDPARKRYRYKLFQPFTHFTLRGDIAGPWKVFGALQAKWSEVRAYERSLLAEERPFGVDGGLGVQLALGVLFDSREPEVTPESGVLLELSARGQPPLPHGAGAFFGLFGSLRVYTSPFSRLVIASRLMAEWLFGEVPFYELVHWGGSVPISGVGGYETLRGVSFGRWRAPGKAVVNAEFRLDVLHHELWAKPFRWLFVPYLDAAMVFGAKDGVSTAVRTSEVMPVHPAAGVGVRAIYDEAFVGRVDFGFGLDPVRESDGRVHDHATFGMYVVFDHTF